MNKLRKGICYMRKDYIWWKFCYISSSIAVIITFFLCCFLFTKDKLDWHEIAGFISFIILRHNSKKNLKIINTESTKAK